MKNTIFVGLKYETVHALKSLLTQCTHWCIYIDYVMKIITMSSQEHQENNNKQDVSSFSTSGMNQSTFPFQIWDISLPQDQTGIFFLHVTKRYIVY
jgi:hypothetical protein